MSLKDYVVSFAHSASSMTVEAVQSQKVAHGAAIATTGTGIATAGGWIATNIGTVASFFGILLTITLMVINYKKNQRAKELHDLEVELARLDIELNKRHLEDGK